MKKLFILIIIAIVLLATPVVALAIPMTDTVVVRPIFTNSAYQPHGFYNYYCTTHDLSNAPNDNAWCKNNYPRPCNEECLTVHVLDATNNTLIQKYSSNTNGRMVLQRIGYTNFINDIDVDNNPDILKQFKHVILLHNEYVTAREYAAITSHPDVTYLYPNALYAEVSYDSNLNTITLLKGHDYKEHTGFNWKWSQSTADEYRDCPGMLERHLFRHVDNGRQITCYPEFEILERPDLWFEIKYGELI